MAESAGILSSGGGWERQHPPPPPPGAAVCRLLLSTALVSALSPRPLSGHYAHLTDGVWQLTEGHTEVLKLAPARPGAGAVLGSWAHPGCACLSPAAPTACWAAWEPGPRTGTPTPAVLPEQPAIPVLCQYWCYLAENEYPDRDGVFVIVNCPVALCLERERMVTILEPPASCLRRKAISRWCQPPGALWPSLPVRLFCPLDDTTRRARPAASFTMSNVPEHICVSAPGASFPPFMTECPCCVARHSQRWGC